MAMKSEEEKLNATISESNKGIESEKLTEGGSPDPPISSELQAIYDKLEELYHSTPSDSEEEKLNATISESNKGIESKKLTEGGSPDPPISSELQAIYDKLEELYHSTPSDSEQIEVKREVKSEARSGDGMKRSRSTYKK